MPNFIGGIIQVALGAIVLATVYMNTIKTQNTSGWTASEIALWSVLGILGIMGLVYGVVQMFGMG